MILEGLYIFVWNYRKYHISKQQVHVAIGTNENEKGIG